MRHYWKITYLLPLSAAASLGLTSLANAQAGTPPATEADAEVEAELDGEAPEVPADEEAPLPETATEEVEQPTVEGAAEVEAEAPPAEAAVESEAEVPADPARDVEVRGQIDADVDQPPAERIRERNDRRGDRDQRRVTDIDARFSQDLGLRYEPAPQAGFSVSGMADDGLWARSGFRTGDRVMRVGERRVSSWNDFRGVMGQYYGQRVPIYVIREGRQMPIYLDLTDYERPFYLDPDYDLNQAQRAGFGIGLNKVDNAVIVSRVYPGSPAALAGMRIGDIIIAANGREIEEVDDVVGYIRSLTPGDDLVLQVRRAGENLRIASRLSTWARALDTAPPEEIVQAQKPHLESHYTDDHTRIDALEERIRDLEAAVRGLRREMSGYETSVRTQLTEPQQRDIQTGEAPFEEHVPAAPLPE